jgi:myo-inositol-hexaphosphate 3-phosphohydrolase
MKDFTKSDLKTGMRVRFRYGDVYAVLKDCDTSEYGHQDILFANPKGNGFMVGSSYGNNLLMYERSEKEYDIVEVLVTCEDCTIRQKSLS